MVDPVLLIFWTFAAAILFASGWLRAREAEIPAPQPGDAAPLSTEATADVATGRD